MCQVHHFTPIARQAKLLLQLPVSNARKVCDIRGVLNLGKSDVFRKIACGRAWHSLIDFGIEDPIDEYQQA
jgi:hypothetical protein